jgi:gliding motility-associated-like protein
LSDVTAGGVWTSSNTATATVNASTGVVTGVAAGTTTMTYTVTNGNGCTSSVSTAVTVNPLPTVVITADNQLVICPSGSVTLTAPAGMTYVWSPNGELTQSITVTQAGQYSVVATNTNGCSNTSNTLEVFVEDNIAPQFTSTPATIAVNVGQNCGAIVNLSTPTVTDDCTAVVSVTNDAPAVFNVGVTVVTWTATDASGNTATIIQLVTVIDNINPIATAPAGVTANTAGSCDVAVILSAPVSSDNCGVVSVVNDAPALFPVGNTLVTWIITDNSGNLVTVGQWVTVVDNELPTILAPSDVNISITAGCDITGVALGSPIVNDNCGIWSITNNAPITYPIGTTTVTWTIVDLHGNSATTTQDVVVIDAILPSIVAPNDITVPINLGCELVGQFLGTPVFADNCGVASVSNNAPAAFPVGLTIVTWTVTDLSGNVVTDTQSINVVDNENPVAVLVSTTLVLDQIGVTTLSVAAIDLGSYDNCGIASITLGQTQFDCSDLGANDVTVTITDNNGNATVQSVTIYVVGSDVDTDVDGIDNSCDSDDDNDGISDTDEGYLVDTDGDGILDYLDTDDDNDGIPTLIETNADFDGDGIPNHHDLDSDDDGASDQYEWNTGGLLSDGVDCDNDGWYDFIDVDKCGAVVPEAFTPNGNNINDLLVIAGLERYDSNNLTIVSRYGDVVFESKNYDNTWDGTSKDGLQLPDGTYYYVLELEDAIPQYGFIYINRVR